MKITGLQKAAIALTIGFIFAFSWTLVAKFHFNNKIPFEFYCLYPISLGVAALSVTLIFDKDLKILQLKFPEVKYSVYAVLFAVLLMFLPFALNLISSAIIINGSPDDNGLIIFGIPIFIILGLAEEVMWRGVLFSVFREKIGYRKTSLMLGVLLAFWNFPLIIFTRFLYPDKSLWLSLPMFTVYSVLVSFIYTYLRTMSKSVWPCVILHGMCSYFYFSMIRPVEMTVDKGNDFYTGDIGVFYLLTAFVTALILTIQLLKKIKHKEKRRRQFRSVKSSGPGEAINP